MPPEEPESFDGDVVVTGSRAGPPGRGGRGVGRAGSGCGAGCGSSIGPPGGYGGGGGGGEDGYG